MTSTTRLSPAVFFVVGISLLAVFVFRSLFLIAPTRPVRDEHGAIVGTEPTPQFLQHKRLQTGLLVGGALFLVAGAVASKQRRRHNRQS